MEIIRTDATHQDFIHLVTQLDRMLAIINGDDHTFYRQFNTLSAIKNVVVLYDESEAISCGAFKEIDESTCEIKRMFTIPSHRGKGYAGHIVDALEFWARELGYRTVILETSVKLESAIQLYLKKGYARTPNYGQYADAADSICFIKNIM
jgi:putative acetyltransferase